MSYFACFSYMFWIYLSTYLYFQISGLTLPSLGGHELSVEQEEQGLHSDHHLLEDGVEKYKCRFCSLKMSVLADIQTHMREVCMRVFPLYLIYLLLCIYLLLIYFLNKSFCVI